MFLLKSKYLLKWTLKENPYGDFRNTRFSSSCGFSWVYSEKILPQKTTQEPRLTTQEPAGN